MERVLDTKIKKVVESRTDTPTMMEALQALAVFYGQQGNTAEARKSLRQDLEKQNIMLCNRFLNLFKRVKQKLEEVESGVGTLDTHCQQLQTRIASAEQSMSDFLNKAQALQRQQSEVQDRAQQISHFLEKFILSEAEVQSLRSDPVDSMDEDGNRPFFKALYRVQEIRNECSKLLGSKHQSAGFELLETLSEHQEAGFRRLHNWILQRCTMLDSHQQDDVEENDVALSMGLKVIRERPALFVHCQECLTQRRKDVIRRRFIFALSHGANNGSLRPIEMQAHDPVRYVGDILAWVHQAVVSEREFLMTVLGPDQKVLEAPQDGTASPTEPTEYKVLTLYEVLAAIMEGLAPPLKVRLLQVLVPQNPLILNFRLLNLIAFYDVTLRNLQLGGSTVSEVLVESRATSQRLFEIGLRAFGEEKLSAPPAYPMDFSASTITTDAGSQISEILSVYEASLIPVASLGYDLEEVLSALIEPVLRTCRLSAEGLDPSDAALFMLNNASSLQASLTSHTAATAWAGKLDQEIDTWLELLVRYQTESILDTCGMTGLLDRAQAVLVASKGPLVGQSGLAGPVVSGVMQAFYACLFTLPQFERLQSPKVRVKARQMVSVAIAEAHRKAYEMLSGPQGGYDDTSFLVHTPQQVQILLDCD